MIRKVASELQVGDTFYRETYRKPDPAVDWKYTVTSLRQVPQHDFFGKMSMMVEVQAVNHVTGPSRLVLGPEEGVWLVPGGAPGSAAPAGPAAPSQRRSSSGWWRRGS